MQMGYCIFVLIVFLYVHVDAFTCTCTIVICSVPNTFAHNRSDLIYNLWIDQLHISEIIFF